jgi:hypothetical protein
MPQASGARFSGQSFTDCAFCPPGRRRFRTARQCDRCARPLCLVCRPMLPAHPYLCPECGGGPIEDTLHDPASAVARISAQGVTPPAWLLLLRDQAAARHTDPEELVVPE